MKTILITGATDGIGLETAKSLASEGHALLLHGRSKKKLEAARAVVSNVTGAGPVATYLADLSDLAETEALAERVRADTGALDIIINNAGVFRTPKTVTPDGLDIRFVVNTIAPYLLTVRLLPLLARDGRVVNLSSAAQSAVDLDALRGQKSIGDMEAYAQSKLALTMWSAELAREIGTDGPAIIAVNPGSLLASKMVREGFGVAGSDLGIGADILRRAALSEEFAVASGRYFDNDSGHFAEPHPDATRPGRAKAVTVAVRDMAAPYLT